MEILSGVRSFISRTSGRKYDVCNAELTKSSLFLLRNLPAARLAVLEHLHNVFDDAVNFYLARSETSYEGGQDGKYPLLEIEDMLLDLVKTYPDCWAPIISAWSIELLGELSSKYSKHRCLAQVSSFSELLQLWMGCAPTKTLVEIASQCLASMVGTKPESCVDALLNASVKHSPHFDWVLAHIGSCFPQTVINRVLHCGLRDYYQQQTQSRSDSPSAVAVGEAKMASVVGILGHLAGQYSVDIQAAVMKMFQESLEADSGDEKEAAVLFLMHLASKSTMLLHVLTTHLLKALTPEVINRVAVKFKKSCVLRNKDPKILLNLVVHLITCVEEGAFDLLCFLIDHAETSEHVPMDTGETIVDPDVGGICHVILNQLLSEMQHIVHCKSSDSSVEVALLKALQPHVQSLCLLLAESNSQRGGYLSRLLTALSVHLHEDVAASILSGIASNASSEHQLSVFVRVQQEGEIRHPQLLTNACQKMMALMDPSGHPDGQLRDRLLHNLHQLCAWEKDQISSNCIRVSLCQTLSHHLDVLALQLTSAASLDQAMHAMELLSLAELPQASTTAHTHLCSAVAQFFFRVLAESDISQKHKHSMLCITYLCRLCTHTAYKKHILRLLVEGSISDSNRRLFGGKCETTMHSSEESHSSLLEQNAHQRKRIVFHAGLIGKGLRTQLHDNPVPQDHQLNHRQMLIVGLSACASSDGDPLEIESSLISPGKLSAELAKFMALLLIELVTPDVMYNGIPWPDEDFMKVTIERDLYIKRQFEDNPVLWNIMEFISEGPGAMCFCSVILRGILATVISHVEGSRDKSFASCKWHLQTTSRIIDFMTKGQMIPDPLHHTVELLPHLSPYEVHLLLLNLWKYVKENPPVPITRLKVDIVCAPRYIAVVRSILHAHIDTLGHLYPLFAAQRSPNTSSCAT